MGRDEERISEATSQSNVLQSDDKGQLTQYLADEEQRALKLEDKLMKEMSATQGLTEELKAKDMMKWVQLTNNLRNEVREIVTQQIK